MKYKAPYDKILKQAEVGEFIGTYKFADAERIVWNLRKNHKDRVIVRTRKIDNTTKEIKVTGK